MGCQARKPVFGVSNHVRHKLSINVSIKINVKLYLLQMLLRVNEDVPIGTEVKDTVANKKIVAEDKDENPVIKYAIICKYIYSPALEKWGYTGFTLSFRHSVNIWFPLNILRTN